ncbi:MAG: helix-turn-helix domain-containing protein, partial [Sinobacteraceae bacterium]|nr:helix-turn-helix domain-containing protein [Nevskiaceae bacterium]
AFWGEPPREHGLPVSADPLDISRCVIARKVIGDITLAEVCCQAQILHGGRVHGGALREASFLLQLQIEGHSVARQDGRAAELQAGDFTLCDGARQYEISSATQSRLLLVGIPEGRLRRHISSPETLTSIAVPAAHGVASLLSGFVRNYWAECQLQLEDSAAERVMAAMLDLLGAAYASVPPVQTEHYSLGAAHRIRIVNYIEAHLHDPDLTPTRVAEACRMTPRYLHHLFSGQDETVARYILRRRLEACSIALTCAARRGRSVTAVAFDHGFNSPTHFGRVFRARFGMTPREYRRMGGGPRLARMQSPAGAFAVQEDCR